MFERYIIRDSSNKGYIDFGIPPTNDTEIEIKYKATNTEDKIVGSDDFKLYMCLYYYNNYLAFRCGSSNELLLSARLTDLYTLRLKNCSIFNVATEEYVRSGTTQDLSGDTSHIQLFNTGNQYGQIYYVKIWQNDKLVVDAVPYQLKDGTGTMYDNVKRSAYAVQGGTFGYVETDTDYNLRWFPSGTVCENGSLYQREVLQVTHNAGGNWELMTPIQKRKGALVCESAIHCGGEPTKIDFTKEVPFVMNWPTNDVKTGLKSTNDQIMQVTFAVHKLEFNSGTAGYCDGKIVGSDTHQIGFNSQGKLYYYCRPSSGSPINHVIDGFGLDEVYSLEFGNNYVKDLWSGEILYSGDTVDMNQEDSIFILGGCNSTLLFNFKLWQGGSLVIDAVPCRFPLGHGGLVNCVDGNVIGLTYSSYYNRFWYNTMLLGEGVHVEIGSPCKFYKQQKYQSTDSGKTWNPVEEYMKGELYETNSKDCYQERWVERGELCIDHSGHTALVLQHSVDGSTWTDSDPLEIKVGDNLGLDSNCINDYAIYSPTYGDSINTLSCYSETSKNGVLTGSEQWDEIRDGVSGYVGTCITSIKGDNALYEDSWTAVILPDTVTAMTANTMQSLYKVSSVTVDNQTPPQIGNLGLPDSTIIIVPKGCAEKYESDNGWKAFDGRIFEEVRGKEYVFKENGDTVCKYNALFKKEPLFLVDGEGNEEQLDFYRLGELVSGYSEDCGSQGQEPELPIYKTTTPIDLGVRFTTNTQIIIKVSYSYNGTHDSTIISDDEGKVKLTWQYNSEDPIDFIWHLDGVDVSWPYVSNPSPNILELGNRYIWDVIIEDMLYPAASASTKVTTSASTKVTTFERTSTLKLFTSNDNADVGVYWIKVIQDGNLVLDAASNGKGQLYDYVSGKVLDNKVTGPCDYKFKYTLLGDGDTEHIVPNDGSTIITSDDIADIIERVTSLTIGNCITTIGAAFMYDATENNGNLDRVFIPSSVTEIRSGAFSDTDISDGITFESATPPLLGQFALVGNIIYVPCGCVDAYANGPGYWPNVNKEQIREYPECNDTPNT